MLVTVCLAAPVAVETAGNDGLISEASVRARLEFLAGDALNGRGSGTRDEWIAAAYIGSQLRRWGIEPLSEDGGYVQDVKIERSEVTAPPVLSFGGRRLTHLKEMTVSRLAGARLSGPLQKYRSGAPVAKGAVLLLPETDPPPAADTVAASITISLETEQIRTRRLANTAPARPLAIQHIVGVPERASIALDKKSYAALAATADGTTVSLDAEARPATMAHTYNAMGRLTGRDRSRASAVILLTAHLDHLGNRPAPSSAPGTDTVFNGADDDASGSVAVLELAEALAKGKRPKRMIIFAWFGSDNLIALLRMNLFVYRDVWVWLNDPFTGPPLPPEPEQGILAWS